MLLLLGAGGAVGCATPGLSAVRAHADLGRAHLISTVPFIPQDAYQCGPAALAMVLRYYGDLSEAQIATAMGISRGAVKSHTARAIASLRTVLEMET